MEMEMGMDSLSFYQHLHLNPPPSSSSGYCYYCPPYAAAAAMVNNSRDVDLSFPPPPAGQGQRSSVARKDRHSKISTAGGMRDRRMRLSLDVARRFFSLQDKLGFDKASKTVQWLLDMSTAGINDLTAVAAAMVNNNSRDVDLSLPPPPASRRERSSVASKDRHSKISTAGGMRDRRMRLSLDVARRFFSLQDKLGFDKASKTVQLLLDMSAAGINDLAASISLSGEEAGSGSVLRDDHVMVADEISAETNNDCKMPTKARRRAGGKICAPVLPDKESRSRARQRARERTMERKRLQSLVSTVGEQAPAPATRQVIPPVVPSTVSNSFGMYYEEQEPWELAGVVFAKPRFHR